MGAIGPEVKHFENVDNDFLYTSMVAMIIIAVKNKHGRCGAIGPEATNF